VAIVKNINTSRALGYLVSEGLCMPAGAQAQWHKSALIQERDRGPVLVPTADVPNNNTTALSAQHVRRT
jgi:hypothetical protein